MDEVAEGITSFRGDMTPRRGTGTAAPPHRPPAAWPRLVALLLALLLASGLIDDPARWLRGAAASQ